MHKPATSTATGVTQSQIDAKCGQLRIAIVSDAVAGRNGVGTYYEDLTCQLQSRVESICLIAPALDRKSELEWGSIPLIGDATQRMAWPDQRRLHDRLRTLRPDVIVIPTLGPFSYFALKFAGQHDVPVAIVSHTHFEKLLELYWSGPLIWPGRWILKKINRWLIRRASGVAALHSEALDFARGENADLIRVVGTPIATDFLDKPLTKRREPPRRILFAGRLAAEKRVQSVIEAAEQLPDHTFTIAGDGPLRSDVRTAERRLTNLTCPGWVSRSELLEIMDHSDLLVLPSLYETFGTVALEALARQKYVLVSRSCGISKWPDLAAGLFFIEKQESLAESIDRLVGLDERQRMIWAAASWDAVRRFNDNTLRVWLRFLYDVAECGRGLSESRTTDDPAPRLTQRKPGRTAR